MPSRSRSLSPPPRTGPTPSAAAATGPVERTHLTAWHRLRAALGLLVLVVALGVLGALVMLGAVVGAIRLLVRGLA